MQLSCGNRTISCAARSLCCHCGRLATSQSSKHITSRKRAFIVYAWGKKVQQHQTSIQVVPLYQKIPLANQPWFIKGGAAAIGVLLVLQVVKKLSNRGSMGTLESRGLVSEGEQSTESNDPFYSKMMRNVNTVQYEELSEEQIEAARRRRSQDRRNNERVDLSKIQLPANHPFAVSKELTEEEESLQRARLSVRRGMPIKDASELKSRQERGGGLKFGTPDKSEKRVLQKQIEL